MQVDLTPDQEAFIREGIARGDYETSDQALQEALAMWEERRRQIAELRAALDEAEDDIVAGRYREYDDDSLPGLAAELKREARQSSS